jgi:diguanylate cyclase (GGDEF)-like protein
MALIEFSAGEFERFDAAPGGTAIDADFDAFQLREQYRALARMAPLFYGVVTLATTTLFCATHARSSTPYTIALVAALLAVVLYRLLYWLRMRPVVDRQTLDVMRRDIRHSSIIGPALTFGFSLVAAIFMREHNVLEKSLLLVAIWTTSVVTGFCLMRLVQTAVLVISGSTLPLVVALAVDGNDLTFWMAALLVLVSVLICYVLIENSHAFSEIVRSRFVISEMHRTTELARKAATAIAYTDFLTGLPNRRSLQSLLAARVEAGQSGAKPFAVGLLDLDGFKPINDIHGHQVGDAILKQVGDRLAGAMKGRGHAARMGGDEFAVICEQVSAQDEAIALGREIRKIFTAPFIVDQLTVHVNCTSGFALFPASADQPDRLIRLADIALYRGKAKRRGDIGVFDISDENAAIARMRLEQALHMAVAGSAIDVFFQPIVDLATGRIRCFESLARWSDPRMGPISPSVFIPIAEQIGLIEPLSRDLLLKATKAAAQWPSEISLAFNLSAEQLSKPNAGPDLVMALEEVGLSPTRFEIEVTETAIMKNLDAARTTIRILRAAGVRVTLDDFGAGHSSLSQLRDLALDKVKIDKSFVDRICNDAKIASLTRAIVDMCRRLDLPCVAEGIERQEQLEELKLSGCEGGQGWLFARAMPEAKVAEFVKARRPRAA